MINLLSVLLCVLAVVRAATLNRTLYQPTEDPFYSCPNNLDDYENGDIIAYRETKFLDQFIFPVDLEKSWLLKIRSEDSLGKPTCFTATLMKPPNAKKNKLVSYQTAEDSASPNCAPLYAFMDGSNDATVSTRIELLLINTMLSEGYYVISPDYEGFNAAFAAGIREGKHTLDGVRAAISSGNFSGIEDSPDTVMWGYSGGTIATGWATVQQPKYAPDLKPILRGACVGGFVTNLTSLLMHLDGSIYAGFLLAGLAGLSLEYPLVNKTVYDSVLPKRIKDVESISDHCVIATLVKFAKAEVFTRKQHWVIEEGYGALADPGVVEALANLTYQNHNLPEIPMLIYHGVKDDIIPFKDAQKVYEDWCERGVSSVEFAVSNSTGHLKEAVFGSPAAVTWINKMINGGKGVEGCKRTVRYSNFNYPSTAVSGFAHAYDSSLRTIFDTIEGLIF